MKNQDSNYTQWLAKRKDEVAEYAKTQVAQRAATPQQADLLEKAISCCPDFTRRGKDYYYHPFIHLSLLVYEGVHGNDQPAIPAAAIGLLVRTGSKLYDDLTDGDLLDLWNDHPDFDIINTATAIACVIPPAIVAELDVPADRRAAMQRILSQGILRMLAGQSQDLMFKNQSDISAKAVEASVVGKSGMGAALVAGLAGHMAGASPETIRAYADFGCALGAMTLWRGDFREMFHESWCRDLAQGTRTLQIALCLEHLSGKEHTGFLNVLSQARTDATAQEQVRKELRKLRHLRSWIDIVNRYTAQAKAALEAADPKEPARSRLADLLTYLPNGV